MNWPNHADYAEAIQNPELCFELPELHTGMVATTPLGLPRAWSGNFASVYEVSGGGQTFAVRCFVRQVTNQQDRYAALERHLAGHDLPCLVPFDFVGRGIHVHERWFPIVKMDWVNGLPLHTFIEQQLSAPEKLAWLAADWREMMARLKPLRIGHGDLQHGNVLVTPDGDLKLVDYDGMYVPLFARERSPELGHANYQHPLRTPEFYDERLDHFPELLIYLSLRALAAEPALWEEYFNGDNLLATAVDLRVPQCSSLWPRLLQSPDEDVRRLTVLLVEYLRLEPRDVPSLEKILNERLSRVVVPAQLDLAPVPVPARESELDAPEEVFARRLDGPLAAMNIERTLAGSRPAPPAPRLMDVLAWSALVTALLSLIPMLRSVAAFTAIGLGTLACVLPGRLWHPQRLVASLAVLLAAACSFLDRNVHVAARLPALHPEPGIATVPTDNLAPSQAVVSTDSPGEPVPEPATERTPRKSEDLQAVSRPLADPPVQLRTTRTQTWKPHAETVTTVLLSADRRHIVSAASDRTLAVSSLAQGKTVLVRTNLAEPVISLGTLTNVGIVAAVDAMHHVFWWSLDGGVPLKTLALDPDSLISPRLSRDGQHLAAGGANRRQVNLQSVQGGNAQVLADLSSWARLARFAPDSRLVAIACLDDTISVRRVDTGTVLHGLNFPDAGISELLFSADGRRLLAVGERGQLRVWSVTSGSLEVDARLPLAQPAVAWLEEPVPQRLVAAAGRRILVVALSTGVVVEEELSAPVAVSALSGAAGADFVTGHANGELTVWHLPDAASRPATRLARP